MLEAVVAVMVVAALLRHRATRRTALIAQAVFADTERRVWGRSQTVAILDAMLPTTHPYARKSAANIYRHFDRWKTLDELEEEYPPGPSWRAQFRFDRAYVVMYACAHHNTTARHAHLSSNRPPASPTSTQVHQEAGQAAVLRQEAHRRGQDVGGPRVRPRSAPQPPGLAQASVQRHGGHLAHRKAINIRVRCCDCCNCL